jgi:hypothetical protein
MAAISIHEPEMRRLLDIDLYGPKGHLRLTLAPDPEAEIFPDGESFSLKRLTRLS